MSEPASFVVIRDGERRTYSDRWAHVFMYRNLVWGPEDLDQWLRQEPEDEDLSEDVCGGVVVDFDQRRLVWDGDDEALEIPRVANVLNQLMEVNWPGYEIRYAAQGIEDLTLAADNPNIAAAFMIDLTIDEADLLHDRPATVFEAVGRYEDGVDDYGNDHDDDDQYDDEFEDDSEDAFEDDAIFDDDELRAWITLIDEQGAVRHRHLQQISRDLFASNQESIRALLELDAAEVPAENVVREGIWFDFSQREIGVWGGLKLRSLWPIFQRNWKDWEVVWATGGYADQCAASGPAGIPMSDAEALAKLAPKMLSTKRFDLTTIFGAVGNSIKKTAIKATGCLAILLSAPVILFGLIAGQLKAAVIAIAIVCVGLTIAFKLIEGRFKQKLGGGPFGGLADRDKQPTGRAPVAGPLDENERSKQLDQMLSAAGLPTLAVIANHVQSDDSFGQLVGWVEAASA